MAEIEVFDMKAPQLPLACDRTIWVCIPDDYKPNGAPYPVIWMHDGQNLYANRNQIDGPSWQVDVTLDKLRMQTGMAAIAVGVAYGNRRMTDYGPWKTTHPKDFRDPGSCGGDGCAYAQFFAEDLRQEIKKRYNITDKREGSAVIGSSMGGYISCYIGTKYQDRFETVGLLSTAVWVCGGPLKKFVDETPQTLPQHAYVYVGGREGVKNMMTDEIYERGSYDLYKRLVKKGVNAEFVVNSSGKHYETDWAIYFEDFAFGFLKRWYREKDKQEKNYV